MITNFSILNDFLSTADTTKCCIDEKSESALNNIWKDFLVDYTTQCKLIDKPARLSVFVKTSQIDFSHFLDQIDLLKDKHVPCSERCHLKHTDFLAEFSNEICDILISLSTNFYEHFDFNLEVPNWVIDRNIKAMLNQSRIISNLRDKNIDIALIDLLDSYLNCLHQSNSYMLKTWSQYFYLEAISDRLLYFIESPITEDDNLKLIKLLIGYNFNTLEFHEYLLMYLDLSTNSDLPYEDQEFELLEMLKVIGGIRIERKDGYLNEVASILDSTNSYLKRGLDTIANIKGAVSPYYFNAHTTLEELLFLFRVMLQVRLISTKFKTQLYQFIERHIKTERTKIPSAQYIRNTLSTNQEIPKKTVLKVRAWLMMMVSHIDTNFRDR